MMLVMVDNKRKILSLESKVKKITTYNKQKKKSGVYREFYDLNDLEREAKLLVRIENLKQILKT